MTIQVRFWWADYSPWKALTTFDMAAQAEPFEVSRHGGVTWRPRRAGTTFADVHDWMTDNDMKVTDTRCVKTRRWGRWEGQYVLTIGKGELIGAQLR